MKKAKPKDDAAARVVVGPATDAVTTGTTVAGVSRGVMLGSRFRLIDVSSWHYSSLISLCDYISCGIQATRL